MKYIEEFRNAKLATHLAEQIVLAAKPNRHYKFMEFCGGHTHAIYRYGIPSLLPKNVEMVHGPGCPVCVLAIAQIDKAIALAQIDNVIFCSYADMLRVPGSRQMNLLQAKAAGADVRMVYSVDDALAHARANPTKQIIFFAIGFETTTPPTAVAIKIAKHENLKNFSVFCNHVLTPPALAALLAVDEQGLTVDLDGFVGPSHVSIVIGSQAYQKIGQQFNKPIVIAGFEPLDVMYSILMLIRQINAGRCDVENQYSRAVNFQGNLKAQCLMKEIFSVREQFEWRGLGFIADSALKINADYAEFDAEQRFPIIVKNSKAHPACQCGQVLRGLLKPVDCKVFAIVCTPENPLGSCMVSSEGACAAVYNYTLCR